MTSTDFTISVWFSLLSERRKKKAKQVWKRGIRPENPTPIWKQFKHPASESAWLWYHHTFPKAMILGRSADMTKDALFYRNVSQSYQITPIALEYLLVFLTSCFLFCFLFLADGWYFIGVYIIVLMAITLLVQYSSNNGIISGLLKEK